MLKLSSEIKIVISDFDGVFTDGSFLIDENFNQQKKMSFKDIMGVSMILKRGIKFAIISGEKINIPDYFTQKFGVQDIYKGIRKKDEVIKTIIDKYNLKKDEILYIGDDINDLVAFEYAKYKVAPQNANYVLKQDKTIQITKASGGDGAFREMVDSLVAVLDA